MLVQVADGHVAGPGDGTGVGHDFAGDDVQEGGLSFAVGADEADVLAFQQAEGCVLQNLAGAEAVGYFFYC